MVEPGVRQALPVRTLLPPVADEEFDRMAALTRRVMHAPIALVSLVDRECQVFPGQAGLTDERAETRTQPLSHSYCQYVVARHEALVITDAREHPVVRDNPAVEDGAIAYAGMPLTDIEGNAVGSLCIVDVEPREWRPDELAVLTDLAAACSAQLQLREANARVAVVAERDRMADELRRGVIRDMFGISLTLGSARAKARGAADPGLDAEIAAAIDAVDAVIARIRTTLFGS